MPVGKKLVIVAAALCVGLVGGIPEAAATLTLTTSVNGVALPSCVDNTACDSNPTVGVLTLTSPLTANGVVLSGMTASSSGTTLRPGPDFLNFGSLSVVNTNPTAASIQIAVGDNNFVGPVTQFAVSGSGTFQMPIGGSITDRWFDDPSDQQGATTSSPTIQPGTLLATNNFTASLPADSFSFNSSGPANDAAPFSMTETVDLSLPGGGTSCGAAAIQNCPQLTSNGETEIKLVTPVPEPASLAIFGTALAGLGLLGRRRRWTW